MCVFMCVCVRVYNRVKEKREKERKRVHRKRKEEKERKEVGSRFDKVSNKKQGLGQRSNFLQNHS